LLYWKDIEKLTRQQIKVVKDNPFPYREFTEEELKNKETDTRGDRRNPRPKHNNASKSAKTPKTDSSNSRKSDTSKQNKKRWY
jgi:ATP-dependent RNA helicase RhlE